MNWWNKAEEWEFVSDKISDITKKRRAVTQYYSIKLLLSFYILRIDYSTSL